MTNKEAIEKLERQKMMICHGCVHPSMVGWCEDHCQLPKAFDMAINALTLQTALKEKCLTCEHCEHCEHCDSELSNDSPELDKENGELISNKRTETHSCDLIERQAAIDALDVLCQEYRYRIPGKRETYSQYNEAWQDALGRAENVIGNLPPAQPEQIVARQIRWMEMKEKPGFRSYTPHCKCSNCGHELNFENINCCYFCGARFVGKEERDE